MTYYAEKADSLKSMFGARALVVEAGRLVVDGTTYPVIDDVIICLDRASWPAALRARVGDAAPVAEDASSIAMDVQRTFGQEWSTFRSVLPEHEAEFFRYFDLVELDRLSGARLCDLGCGMGRWSYFASRYCREIVLVDFSEAIFVARGVLRERGNAIFVMADAARLPFAPGFADLMFSLGVLHHLPTAALDAVVALRPFAPRLLVYLYYALDNRPAYFRALLRLVTMARRRLAGLRNERLRHGIAAAIAGGVYLPLVGLGAALRPFGLAARVPLYEVYHDRSFGRITQDAYDRFFTRIEQRVTRAEIEGLSAHFRRVVVSDQLPYWHFLCER